MNVSDAKQIRQIVKEEVNSALEPVKEDLNIVKKDVQELREDVDALRGDVFTLQDNVKGIRDEIGLGHSRNKREIDEIKTHIGLPLIPDTPEI